ncbi:MAG: hypothetical protein ACLTWO_08080 [Blautia massiliensis (ex Durand et al. 2017)]
MEHRKRTVLHAALLIGLFLLCCTALSQTIYQKLLPAVTVVKSFRGEIAGQGSFDALVPSGCLQVDSSGERFLYTVAEEEGLFGTKNVVRKTYVTVQAEDDEHVDLETKDGALLSSCQVVTSTTRALSDGADVRVLT